MVVQDDQRYHNDEGADSEVEDIHWHGVSAFAVVASAYPLVSEGDFSYVRQRVHAEPTWRGRMLCPAVRQMMRQAEFLSSWARSDFMSYPASRLSRMGLPPWHRYTGRGSEIEAISPDTCPNGHRLVAPDVAISSDVNKISYECLRCSAVVHRYRDGRESFNAPK